MFILCFHVSTGTSWSSLMRPQWRPAERSSRTDRTDGTSCLWEPERSPSVCGDGGFDASAVTSLCCLLGQDFP